MRCCVSSRVPVMCFYQIYTKMDQNVVSAEKEPVFIGKIIEEELRRQKLSVTWLSRKIHCDRRNVYDIFERTSIDTELLYRICQVLNVDFFAYYSQSLKSLDQ